MSQSSSEKLRDETSSLELDEDDSGHDSVDDISNPADERERIASLETAVAWIREEVDQLKIYDKDILQELWKIRNTVQTLREAGKKPPPPPQQQADESRFLDETMDDRSPTPESQPQETPEEDLSAPSSPSPSPSPPPHQDYKAADGNLYTEATLNRMATAPSHLSDDLVLEEFFGSDQLTKLDMFKKQLSSDNLVQQHRGGAAAWGSGEGLPDIAEKAGGIRPGFSMPNISTPTTLASELNPRPPPRGRDLGERQREPSTVKLRLAKNHFSDANRMSYDVASEMEKLRARLQETAKQELAEFDRKYSPKLHHPPTTGVLGAAEGNNHSRQSSLDSSMAAQQQQVATPPSVGTLAGRGGHGGGHSRQHSLPIDPKYLRQMQQQNHSSETTPTLATQRSGWSPLTTDRGRSPTPPLQFGHIRQISGGSMSSDGGTFSPPLTPVLQSDAHAHLPQSSAFPAGRVARSAISGGGLQSQHFKQNNPTGLARIGSDGMSGYAHNRASSGSASSLTGAGEQGNNGGNRTRPQPHYSTSVVKRGGKRGSMELNLPPPRGPPSAMPHLQGAAGLYRYGNSGSGGEEKVPNGRPNMYEQSKRNSRGEEMETTTTNFPRVSSGGGLGRYSQLSPPRMEGNVVPSSPKMSRERRGTTSSDTRPNPPISKHKTTSESSGGNHRNSGQEQVIEPYMTSSQVKSQMQLQNYNYTPFSQQRSYTVSAVDAPKLTKKPGKPSAKNTWI